MISKLTPVHSYYDTWYAKREDLACDNGLNQPSGLKMRQYLGMSIFAPPNQPMIVGCSAFAAMQIYVAAAAKQTGRRGIVYVPKRKVLSQATQWAINNGAEVNFVSPGYPSVYRKAARERAIKEGGCIKWDRNMAMEDVAQQTYNLPDGIKRIIVPTGTGLIAAGVLLGLAYQKEDPLLKNRLKDVEVVAVAASDLSSEDKILEYLLGKYTKSIDYQLSKIDLTWVKAKGKYEKPANDVYLPDGTWLDPFYAAKALPYVKSGDCLWVPGRRAQI